MIDQDTYRLERYARHPEEPHIYLFEVYTMPEDVMYLASIDGSLTLADIYEKVVLDHHTLGRD